MEDMCSSWVSDNLITYMRLDLFSGRADSRLQCAIMIIQIDCKTTRDSENVQSAVEDNAL